MVDTNSNSADFNSKSSIVLQNVLIHKSKLTTGHASGGLVHVVDSYILDTVILAQDQQDGIHFNSCIFNNTEIQMFGYDRLSAVHIDNSTLNNVSVVGGGLLLSLRRSTFQNGYIWADSDEADIRLVDLKLSYVNIGRRNGEVSDSTYRRHFTLHQSTFDHGSIALPSFAVNLLSSNISLAQSPLLMGSNSIIQCSSITRTTGTNENMTGVEAGRIKIRESSIYNFRIGIRLFRTGMIRSSNVYNNSLYNIDNQGVYTIQAEENWWGTSNETEIDNKIYDSYDNINLGQVLYSNYSMTSLENNSDCTNDFTSSSPSLNLATSLAYDGRIVSFLYSLAIFFIS